MLSTLVTIILVIQPNGMRYLVATTLTCHACVQLVSLWQGAPCRGDELSLQTIMPLDGIFGLPAARNVKPEGDRTVLSKLMI